MSDDADPKEPQNSQPEKPGPKDQVGQVPGAPDKAEKPGGKDSPSVDVSNEGTGTQPRRTVNAINNEGEGIVSTGDNSSNYVFSDNKIEKLTLQLGDKEIPLADILSRKGKSDATRLPLNDVGSDEREKIRAVYIRPKEYQEVLDRLKRQEKQERDRILIIYGEDHTGKYASALALGMDLLEADRALPGRIIRYGRTRQENRPLVDVFCSDEIYKEKADDETPRPAIFIIREAFENGISTTDLDSTGCQAIQHKLSANQSYLILTTDLPEEKISGARAPRIEMHLLPGQMEEVFSRHLEWYRDHDRNPGQYFYRTCQDNAPDLVRALDSAFKIDAFFERGSQDFDRMVLGSLEPGKGQEDYLDPEKPENKTLLKEQVERLAVRINRLGQEPTRPWFNGLSENDRLFAMLAVLFSDMPIQTIDLIFDELVSRLRRAGVATLTDSRERGRGDTLFAIRARLGGDEQVYFDNAIYIQEIWEQINNRHALLWEVVELSEEWIKKYRGPEFWELRRSFGIAIGRLGIHRQQLLEMALDRLAEDASGEIVAVAGYALDGICQLGHDFYPFVLKLLEKWCNSGDPDLTWAAAASIWRVYETLSEKAGSKDEPGSQARETLEKVDQDLTHLAETFDMYKKAGLNKAFKSEIQDKRPENLSQEEFENSIDDGMRKRLRDFAADNMRSIMYALRFIWFSSSGRVVDLLCRWLEAPEDSNLRFMGVNGAMHLLEETDDPRQILIDANHAPLLKLARKLLEVRGGLASDVLGILAGWLDQERWSQSGQGASWPEKVQTSLLRAINHMDPSKLEGVRSGLIYHWLGGRTKEVQRFGWALLTHTYIIAGQPILLPGMARAGFALDASAISGDYDRSEFGRGLSECTAARMDTYAFLLGRKEPVLSPDLVEAETRLVHTKDLPRLIMPSMEWVPKNFQGELLFFMILAWEQVLDLDDLEKEDKRVILAHLRPEEERGGQVKPPPYTIIQPEENSGAEFRRMVEGRIDLELAGYLSGMQTSNLAAMLNEQAGFPSDDLEKVVAWLEERVKDSDSAALAEPGACDALRLLVSGVVWLARVEPSRCVTLLSAWMGDEDRTTRRCLGEAASRLLFRIFSHPASLASQAQADEQPRQICSLGAALLASCHDPATLHTVLSAIRLWLAFPAWADLLLDRDYPGKDAGKPAVTLLADLVDHAGLPEQTFLEETLQDWLKKDQPAGEAHSSALPEKTQVPLPQPVHQAIHWLRVRLAARRRLIPRMEVGRLWLVNKGSLLRTLGGDAYGISSLAFSLDGSVLASGSCDGIVRLWRVGDGYLLRSLKGHTDRISSVAFSPDGSILASGSTDRTIRLWQAVDGSLLRTLGGHTDYVNSIAFSPDGSLLASGSTDRTVRLWQVADGSLLQTLKGHAGDVLSVAFSEDGNILATGSGDTTVRLWRVEDGSLLRTLKGHTNAVCSVTLSPNGLMLASGSRDKTLRFWQVSDGASLGLLEGHADTVSSVTYSSDGSMLASGSYDRTVRLWRADDGTLLHVLEGHANGVATVAFSPEGSLLASGSYDSTIRLPEPGEGHKFAVILLDASQTGNQSLAETALECERELAARSLPQLHFETIVFRLGETIPASTWPQLPQATSLMPGAGCRPCLAMPILELLPRAGTAFILCLTNQVFLDLDDWPEGWQTVPRLVYSYGAHQPVFPEKFRVAACQPGRDREADPVRDARALINEILAMLK
jgi:WD40 repeat protein